MQSSVETTQGLERRLSVQVPAAEIEQRIDVRLQELSQRVRLKGFRPGKVPQRVMRQQFGQQVRQEVLSEVLQSSYAEAVAEQQLRPAGAPQIEPSQLEPGKDLEYVATLEVLPQIELQPMDDLTVERPVVALDQQDIDEVLARVREQHAHWHAVERPAQDGDRLEVDFVGTIGGEVFDGGTGENVAVELGAGRFLPAFEENLRGAGAGEERTFEVPFPADYGNEALAGKTAEFTVKVNSVSERHLPEVDDAFAEQLGVAGGVAGLHEELQSSMRREADEAIRNRLKQQVFEQLVARHELTLPTPLVQEEVGRLRQELVQRLRLPEGQQGDLPAELFEEEARRRVAVGLLVSEIIRQQSIELDEGSLQRVLDRLTAGQDRAAELQQAYRRNEQAMSNVRIMAMEDQVVDWLLAKAQATEQPMRFTELMAGPQQADEVVEDAEPAAEQSE